MNSIALRSAVIVGICGLCTGLLELFHQGFPPLLEGLLPVLLYGLQSLSLYASVGAAVGLVSAIPLLLLDRVTNSSSFIRMVRDLIPVGLFLFLYFSYGGGRHPHISVALDPPTTGVLGEGSVYVLVVAVSLFLVLAGFFLGSGESEAPGRSRWMDFIRGFSVCVVLLALAFGLSEAARSPVGGSDAYWEGHPDSDRPVIVFGIDGACWDILRPLVDADAMPNLEELMEKGVYGNFRTVGAALSSAVWTDMATGKDRRKHGILGNVVIQDGEYLALPPRSYHREVPAVWNILSASGERVAIANWRVTYPPEVVNGVMASMLVFDERDKVFPPSLEEKILEIGDPQRKIKDPMKRRLEGDVKGPGRMAEGLLEDLAIERNVFNFLAEYDNFDFYAYYSHTTDAAKHLYRKFRDPHLFRKEIWDMTEEEWQLTEENIRNYGGFIDQVYIKADSMLGETIDRIGGEPAVVVLSDHGQQPSEEPIIFVDIYRLLQLAGYMKTDSLGNVDFGKSLLFPPTPLTMQNIGGLAVNKVGRERLGLVEPGEETDRLIDEAVEKLGDVRVQETGEPFFRFVREIQPTDMKRHVLRDRVDMLVKCNFDAYHPDRHIVVGDSVCGIDEVTEVRGLSGMHTNLGMFLISSPRFSTGILLPALNTMSARVIRYRMRTSHGARRRILERAALFFNLYEEVETLDVTPTLLTMFDLPVGRDMDGKVLTRLMRQDVLDEHRVAFIDSYDDLEVVRKVPEESRSVEDEMEMLRALGYIK